MAFLLEIYELRGHSEMGLHRPSKAGADYTVCRPCQHNIINYKLNVLIRGPFPENLCSRDYSIAARAAVAQHHADISLAKHIEKKLKLLFVNYPVADYASGDLLGKHTKNIVPQQYADVIRLVCSAWPTLRRLHVGEAGCRFDCRDPFGSDNIKHYVVCEHLCHALHQASVGLVLCGLCGVGLGPVPELIRACIATAVYRSIAAGTHGVTGVELLVQLVPAVLEGLDNLADQMPRTGSPYGGLARCHEFHELSSANGVAS